MCASSCEKVVLTSEDSEIHGLLREPHQRQSRAVVFCHGAFECKENWSAYAGRLAAQGYATLTFDFTGHGESQGLRSLVSLPVWAYNVRDVLNHLQARGYRRFALVGWGSGGAAALIAAAHDRRVSCAAILAAPVYLLPDIGERAAYGLISGLSRIKTALFGKPIILSRLNELEENRFASDNAVDQRYRSDPAVRRQYRSVPIPQSLDSVWMDITPAVARVTLPVLVIHGAEDEIVAVDQSEKLLSLLQGDKELKLIDGCGHALHLDEKKGVVFQLISDWIMRYL